MQNLKVGAYIRISKKENKMNSIANQELIIGEYIYNHKNLEIFNYYVDNGYSGTDFDRPDFKRMIEDITNKKINIVIVKDLSRLGRNYIEVGRLLDSIFPLYNIKLISINDNINGIEDNDDKYLLKGILNILNDSYSKDISEKVKSTFRIKKLNGEFIGVSAPFGYLKDSNDKHKYIIDEDASKIVIKIFDMALSGKTSR